MPDYSPLPTEDGFPVVPIEDAHPYHIVVVAGQECPTESGVPRGLAGGVLRGMKLGNHLRKEKKDKEKEKEKENDKEGKELEKEAAEHLEEAIQNEAKGEKVKERDGKEGLGVPKDSREQASADRSTSLLAPGQTDEADSSESTEMSRSGSPAPASQTGSSAALGHTPSLHRHQHHQGSKGWSTMLDGVSIPASPLYPSGTDLQTGCVVLSEPCRPRKAAKTTSPSLRLATVLSSISMSRASPIACLCILRPYYPLTPLRPRWVRRSSVPKRLE